ncbi:hypothetical protein GLAREA_03037 [Glarea lozoyensis ATCC 20868]|uniref:Uncharacterized protein n=1 Tax=Glarea lozoyensis (strain ATCC 20868 / MF5171) TaxID=1116229 RepID=S3DKN3_GLAL2|nr:uncharacterized protein GLAREA_03037 [Glarea lozoyensis ATCC 20868]EPE27123.1 hypothetical protein GLAREA_03037 [Glarea lozoyensis ATCC 20868]
MCFSSIVSYSLCGCRIKVPIFCPKSKERIPFLNRLLHKPVPTCTLQASRNLYIDAWCYRCGMCSSEAKDRIAKRWAEEKSKRRMERKHPPMPACGDLPFLGVLFEKDSLPLWEQKEHWKKNNQDDMVMLRCNKCDRPPFLRPASFPSEYHECCNEPCEVLRWEDWQGFPDTPISTTHRPIGEYFPDGIYLRYHTDDGMRQAPEIPKPDVQPAVKEPNSRHRSSSRFRFARGSRPTTPQSKPSSSSWPTLEPASQRVQIRFRPRSGYSMNPSRN